MSTGTNFEQLPKSKVKPLQEFENRPKEVGNTSVHEDEESDPKSEDVTGGKSIGRGPGIVYDTVIAFTRIMVRSDESTRNQSFLSI